MNWKETPWLFANGRFKLRYNGGDFHFNGFLDYGDDMAPAVVFLDYYDGDNTALLSDCQLIARHPEDMTDEEWGDECFDFYESPMGGWDSKDQMKEIIEERIEAGELHSQTLLYLLSIGVYPFPWPKDGSVIREE